MRFTRLSSALVLCAALSGCALGAFQGADPFPVGSPPVHVEPSGHSLVVDVWDQHDLPLGGVHVWALDPNGNPAIQAIDATTDATGRLIWRELPPWGFTVCAAIGHSQQCQPATTTDDVHLRFQLQAAPRQPNRTEVLDYRGHLADLRDAEGRVIWTPALPGAPDDVRRDWLTRIAEAGGTHVPIGPFTPGPAYPGVAWSNPDWTNDPQAIRALVVEILETPTDFGHGMVPVLFLDGGDSNPIPRLERFYPVAAAALDGLWDSVLTVPAGWEPVVGAWRSAEVSWALEHWHATAPQALIAYHGSPERLVGSSNCPHCPGGYEPDDPWRGGEAAFYQEHGGQFINIALYQLPHGPSIYRDCDYRDESGGCPYNRWWDYVQRIGAGINGWRRLPLVAFETCAYEYFRGLVDETACRQVSSRMQRVAAAAGVTYRWGNGAPLE